VVKPDFVPVSWYKVFGYQDRMVDTGGLAPRQGCLARACMRALCVRAGLANL
jgi:hypothetical protein